MVRWLFLIAITAIVIWVKATPLRKKYAMEGEYREKLKKATEQFGVIGDSKELSSEENYSFWADDETQFFEGISGNVYAGFPEGLPKGGLWKELHRRIEVIGKIPPGFELHRLLSAAACRNAGRLELIKKGPTVFVRIEDHKKTRDWGAGCSEGEFLKQEKWAKEGYRKTLENFLAHFDKSITDEGVSREEDMYAGTIMYELIESGNTDVLCGLMVVLTKKIGGCGMLDESFPQQIFNYYTHEQIMDAIFEKFDAIYDNDEGPDGPGLSYILEGICSDLWSPYWKGREDGRGFQRFRELFNKTRPRHAERFLNEMEKYKDGEEVPMIQTLREDMKKW
jgi:hypothetical protein